MADRRWLIASLTLKRQAQAAKSDESGCLWRTFAFPLIAHCSLLVLQQHPQPGLFGHVAGLAVDVPVHRLHLGLRDAPPDHVGRVVERLFEQGAVGRAVQPVIVEDYFAETDGHGDRKSTRPELQSPTN